MVADVGRVVTGGAGSVDDRQARRVVEPAHAADGNRQGVEQLLAAGDGGTRAAAGVVAELRIGVVPAIEQAHGLLIERIAGGVIAEGVVDGIGGLFGGVEEPVFGQPGCLQRIGEVDMGAPGNRTAQPTVERSARGLASVTAEFLSLFACEGRLSVTVAEVWARSRGVMLVEILDALNTMALDLCDAPVMVEQGGALVLDAEIADAMPGFRGRMLEK